MTSVIICNCRFIINNGINIPYHVTVSTSDGREVYRCSDYSEEGDAYTYSQVLFRNDPSSKMGIVRIHFPDINNYIFSSIRFMIPSVIFTEANISYLLPGALALKGSFGVTIESVQGDISRAPYLIVSASLIMALLMICFNLFGNGLRDAFNPSLKGGE